MSQFQFGNFENRGGWGVFIFQECPNFNLGILKTEGGGLYFSKISQFQLSISFFHSISIIRNVWNSKMSHFGSRGGSTFLRKVCPKFSRFSILAQLSPSLFPLFGTLFLWSPYCNCVKPHHCCLAFFFVKTPTQPQLNLT